MLLKIQHEKNDKNIRERVSSIYKGALKQKDLTLRVVAESVGYTKVEKGISRINRLIDAGKLPQQEGDLQYKICRMLCGRSYIKLLKEMEAESISYQSALQKRKTYCKPICHPFWLIVIEYGPIVKCAMLLYQSMH